ncbi:AraC family transcriptional regulator [Aliivibrio kagoshimensis]|uniref:AraC family transcriptional regulator n=1 Tax=Aliivibrio kagoshimensis TaxID=2910230 RepID=UPI003D12C378
MEWPEYFHISETTEQDVIDQSHLLSLEHHHILQCGIGRCHEDFTIFRRNPNMHMLIFTRSGKGWLETPDERWSLEPDSVICVPAGNANGFGIEGDYWEMSWVFLAAHHSWSELVSDKIYYSSTRSASLLNDSIRCLIQSLSLPYPVGNEIGSKIVEQIALMISYRMPTSVPKPLQKLEQVFQLCQKQLHRDWSVTELAQLYPCSEPHFHRLCRRYLGHSPMAHLTRMRMEHASRLMTTTDWPIQIISEAVGYPNSANFSTRFKKWSQMNPREFKKRFAL